MQIKEIYQNYPLSLLLDADPDIKKIEKYLNKGFCFGLYNDSELIGVFVLKYHKDKTAEIMNLSVKETHRRKGFAKEMITAAEQKAKADLFQTLFIATAKDSLQQKLYEKCGFEVVETIKDYFKIAYKKPIIENGETLCDLVRLKKVL